MFGLESLIAPLTVDEFLDDYYERSACHIASDPGKFGHLYEWDNINSIVNDRLAVHSKLKLVLNKRQLLPETLEGKRQQNRFQYPRIPAGT